ncbi:MAG TPA: 16S rRNA (guanine(966)-N(2))-methyltransferase RsmD [Deltaproteobacteria bacterium]|nr:16S rRNA (guanine(966)-N(2))-methyltransferase RsmD [Deltaproteobacteria bacterium]
MRITGGDLGGRAYYFPPGIKERPTSDFLRETIFNLLGPVEKTIFIDLFAGSGGVGLEAASRGARQVYLVEKNKKLADIIKKNLRSLSLETKCFVIAADVKIGLKELAQEKCRADFVFADPPYNRGLVATTLNCLGKYKALSEESIIVIQHSINEKYIEFLPDNIYQVQQRKYGENALTFFKRSGNDTG